MNPMTMYVNTAKLVVQSTQPTSADNARSCYELPRQLWILRQMLSCVACCQLLNDPFEPVHGQCFHNVCRLCVRSPKQLRPVCLKCRNARDFRTYIESKQFRCLLICYKNLCEYLLNSDIFYRYGTRKLMQQDSVLPVASSHPKMLGELITEGVGYEDVMYDFNKDLPKPVRQVSMQQQLPRRMPALVSPLSSTSAATPLVPNRRNMSRSALNTPAAMASTPPNTFTETINNPPNMYTPIMVKEETSPPPYSNTQNPTNSSSQSAASSTRGNSPAGCNHAQLEQLNQLANAGNITYLGPNTRGIVVPIVSSSVTTTVPLSIASSRLQTLNRQLAQARAMNVAASESPSSTSSSTITAPSTAASPSAYDPRPQQASLKVSLPLTLPSVNNVTTTLESLANNVSALQKSPANRAAPTQASSDVNSRSTNTSYRNQASSAATTSPAKSVTNAMAGSGGSPISPNTESTSTPSAPSAAIISAILACSPNASSGLTVTSRPVYNSTNTAPSPTTNSSPAIAATNNLLVSSFGTSRATNTASMAHASTAAVARPAITVITSLSSSAATPRAGSPTSGLAQVRNPPPIKTVSNGSAMYSVLYTGIGNKITIKRKTDGEEDDAFQKKPATNPAISTVPSTGTNAVSSNAVSPTAVKTINKKRGCRCGITTTTPGKLTCCGQRCPCYVDSRSCLMCKCRGCRNPHRPDGNKVRPVIPELACYEIQMADDGTPAGELPIATNSAVVAMNAHHDDEDNDAMSPESQNSYDYTPCDTPRPYEETTTATLVPIRGFQQSHETSPVPPLTSAALPLTAVSLTQAPLGANQSTTVITSNPTQSNVLQMDKLPRATLIQNAEGKYQVVSLYTAGTTQNATQVPGLQRLHTLPQSVVSVSGANNFILPNTVSIASRSRPTNPSTMPQFILQSQQQQIQTQTLHSISGTSRIGATALPLQIQQQLKQNIITVHTLASAPNVPNVQATPVVLTSTSSTVSPAPVNVTHNLIYKPHKHISPTDLQDDSKDGSPRFSNIFASNANSTANVSMGRTGWTLGNATRAYHPNS